jgi:inosine/xanthosine triphosphate pyrophosphatase family protein
MGVNMGTTGMAESANGRSAFMISQEAGRLHVSVSQTGERTVNLYVADMLGSVVYRKENFTVADHAELIIDCWQFKPGVYTVTMQSHDGGSTQKIFIGN